jgi:nucleoside-diphosphate-sugar epimerase
MREPEFDREVNAEGTRRVAAAARAVGARRMISASSAAVYGEPVELPLKETSSKSPTSPYGASKLEAEGLLASELAGSGLDFASFRFSNVYGPRQDAAGEGGVVSIFSDSIHRGAPPVIFGDGSQTRDFIYVGDVVAAIIAASLSEAELATGAGDGPAYNISTGERTSVDELLMALRQAAGYLGPAEHEAPRAGDILHSALDPTKAAEVRLEANVALESGSRPALVRHAVSGRAHTRVAQVLPHVEARASAELTAADDCARVDTVEYQRPSRPHRLREGIARLPRRRARRFRVRTARRSERCWRGLAGGRRTRSSRFRGRFAKPIPNGAPRACGRRSRRSTLSWS